MKNYSPKQLSEVVQELDKIDKKMACWIKGKFNQNDYENGSRDYMHSARDESSTGPLDFFCWDISCFFSFSQFKRRDEQLNKIFKKKAKAAKKLKRTISDSYVEIRIKIHQDFAKVLEEEKAPPKVKNAVALMQALVDEGYTVNSEGVWCKWGKQSFMSKMWQHAGTEDLGGWNFEQEWLE